MIAPLRARVLITLVKAENASAPPTFFEQCDTFRAITAPRSALSARLLVGSMLGSSRKRSRLLSIARVYRPVVARVIEPPCGPVNGGEIMYRRGGVERG